jgi:hypothetical protein
MAKGTNRKRGGLGDNPLDALVPSETVAPHETDGRPRPTATSLTGGKSRFTLHLSIGLMDRAKNASYWTPGLSLAGLAEAGIRAEVERLEKAHGKPFPERERELVGGRPMRS